MTFRKPQEKFYGPARELYSPPIWTVQSAMVNRTVHRVDYRIFLGVFKKTSVHLWVIFPSLPSITKNYCATLILVNEMVKYFSYLAVAKVSVIPAI